MERTTSEPDTAALAALSDDELIERVKELAECERRASAAVRLLAPHFTSANHLDLLKAARHRSKQQIHELIAS